jgi:hypothetical protein
MENFNSQRSKIKNLEAYAEKSYDEMYSARGPVGAGAYYREAKEALTEAIHIAKKAGLKDEAKRLEERLEHIKQVYVKHMS